MNRTNISALLIFVACLITGCGTSDQVERNIKNSRELKVGMNLDKALEIMGEPNQKKEYPSHPKYGRLTTYYYKSPIGASDWIYFHVDSTNMVVEVAPYEK